MTYEKKLAAFADYIRSGEKKETDFKVGIEIEHFILSKYSYENIDFLGENGVESTIRDLYEIRGGNPLYEGDHILGLNHDNFAISTEPGGQLEIALKASSSLNKLEKTYKDLVNTIREILEKKDQILVCLGYMPISKIDDLDLLPKKRYDFMYKYFEGRGNLSHNMMKGTAGLQVILDYSDEEDFRKKYFLGSAMSPILYTLFENSAIFEGMREYYHNIRQYVWENTDPDRSGIYPQAFDEDFSYEKYAHIILNTPLIFSDRGGDQVYTGDKLTKDIFDQDRDGDDFIYHCLSMVFPDLRVKTYLEFRMMDSVPFHLNFAIIAMMKGIFYSKENLDLLYEAFSGISMEDVNKGRENTRNYGINGIYFKKPVYEWGRLFRDLAKKGLKISERPYLKPLDKIVDESRTPRDDFDRIWEKDGLSKAIDQMGKM